ncbi:transglutaminase domain-containing protein [Alloiococcus sp. CFN-8]|uniref:transglutaminase domain-containing protein n=1 Tax=Alloiococcus sp. CFN-8 TaxID=3416081 RepID=UPI003CF89351
MAGSTINQDSNRYKRRRNKKRKMARRLFFMVFILIIAGTIGYFAGEKAVFASIKKAVVLEVGEAPVELGLFDKSGKGSFLTDTSSIDMNTPGEYSISIKKYFYTVPSRLIVKDTIAPQGKPVEVTLWKGERVEATALVAEVTDKTEVSISYKEEPDFTRVGNQETVIVLKDAGNNITELVSNINVLDDKVAPVIYGVKDIITAYAGDTISYRTDVTVKDNSNKEIELKIDSSSVDSTVPGNYTVVYSAEDGAGNKTTKKATVKIMERKVTEDEVYALADSVLEKIIDDSMSKEQKARAIYSWIERNIGYVGKPTSFDWLKAAYDGFTKKKADCYIYYSVSRALLTRAGIENLEVVREDGGHYWNLAKTDDGWYHFDTTPRAGGGEFCLLTDGQLKSYSDKHKNSHLFDADNYPRTP